MNLQPIVDQTEDARDAEKRAHYVAQLRRAADLIEQYELPTPYGVNINAPINDESDEQEDAILSAVADRVGMTVNRSRPSQPNIKFDLGDGGVYHIYYGTRARQAAFNKANEAMRDWDKGLDEPAEPSAEEPEPERDEEKTGPQLAAGWKNEDGTVGRECVCGVTFDGFEPKDAELLDDLFAKHECNVGAETHRREAHETLATPTPGCAICDALWTAATGEVTE